MYLENLQDWPTHANMWMGCFEVMSSIGLGPMLSDCPPGRVEVREVASVEEGLRLARRNLASRWPNVFWNVLETRECATCSSGTESCQE